MKWFVMLGLMLVGCGSDDGDPPKGCAALSLEACEDDATCAVRELRAWSTAGECWKPSAPAACVPARATCAPVDGCLLDEDNQRWLSDGDCAPEGWHETSGDECSGEPLCD
jgi:hypothetical protein